MYIIGTQGRCSEERLRRRCPVSRKLANLTYLANRTYDCKALNPYRRRASGLPGGNRTKWEVHYDPYDITVV
jgi:hypothetical protein